MASDSALCCIPWFICSKLYFSNLCLYTVTCFYLFQLLCATTWYKYISLFSHCLTAGNLLYPPCLFCCCLKPCCLCTYVSQSIYHFVCFFLSFIKNVKIWHTVFCFLLMFLWVSHTDSQISVLFIFTPITLIPTNFLSIIIDGHSSCFPPFPIMSSGAANIYTYVVLHIWVSFSRGWTDGMHEMCMFNFGRLRS